MSDLLAAAAALVSIIVPISGFAWYWVTHPKDRKKIIGAALVACALMVALLGGTALMQHAFAPSPTATPGTAARTPGSSSPTPTPTVRTIPENLTIPCVSGCDPSTAWVMVVLDTVVIDPDPGQRNMRWTFTLSSGQGCSVELQLTLEDPSGTQYQAGGQVGPAAPFTEIAPGQSVDVVGTFALLPKSGVTYQLQTSVVGYCYAAYQTESFTF